MIEEALLTALKTSVNREKLLSIGIPSLALPPITRGFPQLLNHKNPQEYFCDLPSLKRQLFDKALLHLYRTVPPPKGAKVVILTWVIGDGFGDYAAQLQTAQILSSVIPHECISLLTILYKEARFPREPIPFSHHVLRYTLLGKDWRKIACEVLSPEVEELLKTADYVLQIPTFYPHTQDILPDGPKYDLIGEGGWLDSPHFHPLSGARCMGLHYLEKGLFMKTMPSVEAAPKQFNRRVSQILFGNETPSEYLTHTRFNAAYTYTDSGLYLYLHILLKRLENEKMRCDIALFDLSHLLNNMDALYLPLLKNAGVRELQIFFQDHRTTLHIANKGKMVRLIHVEPLTHFECLALIAFSQDLVGCRGDGSLSEAISANKPFFLDPPKHKRELIEDLVALSAYHLPDHPKLTEFFQLHLENPGHRSPSETSYFTAPLLQALGDKMGSLLKNPSVSSGILKLNRILQTDYAVNPVLQNLTLRALTHKAYLHIETLEKKLLDAFLHGDTPLHEVLAELKVALSSLKLC